MPATHRVVVRSIGTATPAVPAALARALPFAPERLVRCVYQAPGVLLDGLAEEQAVWIRDLLAGTGLDVAVAAAGAPFEDGGPQLELAVHVGDATRFREVAAEVARFVGCDVARAIALLCAAPPVVLGRVSQATADALTARLADLGAEVDASHTATARYDVFVDEAAPELRARITRLLQRSEVSVVPEGPLVALGVERAVAEDVWKRIGTDAKWQLLDHAFQRFDVILTEAVDTPAAAEAIVAVSGMPVELVTTVCAHVPVVLREAVRPQDTTAALARLAEAGIAASARLVTLANWDIVIHSTRDVRAAAEALSNVLGRERPPFELALRRLPARIDAPIGLTRGRWLLHELALVGTAAVLEER